jgi:hypothetical protein
MRGTKLGWKHCNCEPIIQSPSTLEVVKTIAYGSAFLVAMYGLAVLQRLDSCNY